MLQDKTINQTLLLSDVAKDFTKPENWTTMDGLAATLGAIVYLIGGEIFREDMCKCCSREQLYSSGGKSEASVGTLLLTYTAAIAAWPQFPKDFYNREVCLR